MAAFYLGAHIANMPNSSPNINFSQLNLDLSTLNAFEQLLNDIEQRVTEDPLKAVTFLYELRQDIVQLKNQKGKSDTDMIHVGVSELKQSFNAHYTIVKAQNFQSASFHLLIFYAVECGLKSIWLKRNNLRSTEQIRDQTLLTKDGHNFGVWIRKLGISAAALKNNKIPGFHLARGGSNWDAGKAHQAWRYGAKMEPQNEKILVEWLENLCSWIKENINK